MARYFPATYVSWTFCLILRTLALFANFGGTTMNYRTTKRAFESFRRFYRAIKAVSDIRSLWKFVHCECRTSTSAPLVLPTTRAIVLFGILAVYAINRTGSFSYVLKFRAFVLDWGVFLYGCWSRYLLFFSSLLLFFFVVAWNFKILLVGRTRRFSIWSCWLSLRHREYC